MDRKLLDRRCFQFVELLGVYKRFPVGVDHYLRCFAKPFINLIVRHVPRDFLDLGVIVGTMRLYMAS